MTGEQQHVVLWSKSTNKLRTEALEKYLSGCRAAYAVNRAPPDWAPLFIGPFWVCSTTVGNLWDTLAKRDTTVEVTQ